MRIGKLRWQNLGFRQQLIFSFCIGVVIAGMISAAAISTLSKAAMNDRFMLDGEKVVQSLAVQSTLSLLYESADNVNDYAETLLSSPDIIGVAVIDLAGMPLLSIGTASDKQIDVSSLSRQQITKIESRSDWQFIAPVYTNPLLENSTDSPFTLNPVFPELIGYVQVIKDKKILHKVTNDILKSNFLINILLCASLLGLMMFITGRVSRPINLLAQTMRQGISGRSHVRVMVSGPRDIAEMQNVFNQMMEVLEACELELKKTRDAALESARIKGEFAFIVTHELRTPLNGVLGMLEILQNMELTEKQKNYVGIAKESGESLLELVNDILDFSRYEAGKMDASAQDFDLRCMLDNIIGLAGGKINSENVDIGFFLSADVPRALNADASRLKQVLLNLVGNAAKFTKQGEISISAERTQHIVGDGFFLRFEVSDTGIGIPEQVHAQIFEPFQQADASTTRSYGGSGLGLAICKQIVEAHGGEIGLRSTLGEGSTFWFTFPVSSAAQAVSPIVVADHALQGQRVLMAEPSAVIRKHVTQICEDWGVQVKTAVTLQQMLDMLASADHPFDLVLVAAGMKGPQGKTLESLLAIEPLLFHTPLIILGQMAAAEEHHAKIRAVVDKPIRVALLHKALTDSLGAEAAPVAQASAVQGATDETKGRISNVLVVEDNRANQIVVSSMLERLGLCATIASNGIEALALIEKHRFDVILMDCNMPEMDGIETTHRIRNLPSDAAHTPIIAMTANAAEIYMERCLAAGMNDCISKPTKLSVLQDKLLSGTLPSIQAVPNSDEEPALDEEVLEELKTAIGDALPRLLTVFAEDLSVYLEKMRQALNEGMASQIHSIAHTIKGSAGNIGAKRVAEVCKRIETAVHGADLGAVRALYTLVVSESERLIALIKQRIEVMTQEESHDELAKSASVQKEQAVASSILIVDDDRSTRMSMRDILKQEGYQIIEAEDGKNALELCGAHPPDLILMDANMPVMDGFTTCRLIKHQKALAHIPVLIVTGLEDESSIERAFAAGATDYVSKPVNYSVLRRRITHLMSASRAEMRMKQLAYNDSLTGLPNRMQFTNHINHLLAEENPLAVMFIDVDRFKLINDTLGHDTGDMLLKIVAERLLGCVREDDLVARLGGDEFTIVTKNVESREVIAGIARKICQAFTTPVAFPNQEIFVKLSIGISLYPHDARNLVNLMNHADTAMFHAKRYQNDFRFFESSMITDVSQRLELERDLRRAIENQELVVYYQPQADLTSGRVIGMEALVRWRHPQRGLVPPLEFIPVAESIGLINEIGRFVLQESCRQLRVWLDCGYGPLRMAVNLSGRQIEKGNITKLVSQVLFTSGIPADCLELEITESVVMEHAEEMITVFHKFKDMGLSLAIDDFGTGYSSLAYLKRFPIDTLKIDRSFIEDLPHNREDMAIVTSIIALAKGLNLKVVAEGIERANQMEFLREHHCDYIQGYHLSKPVPPDEFEARFLIPQAEKKAGGTNVTVFKPRA